MVFSNRKDAGIKLAKKLKNYSDAIVIGLPRGGVIVAAEVAKELKLPLDVIVPRKIGSPHNPEFALGAIAGNVTVLSKGVQEVDVKEIIAKEKREAQRREKAYRQGKSPLKIQGKTVILIDDGIATGSTMRATVRWAKGQKAKKIIVAVPVGPKETIEELKEEADEIICLETPSLFFAVGQFYDSFEQTTDEEVIKCLYRK